MADLGTSLVAGSRPADEALEVVDRALAETPSVWLQLNRAWLLAMLDRGDEARQIAEEANARLRDQGDARWGEWMLAEISTLAGDYEDASNRLRILCEWLETRAQLGFLESYLGQLGRSLCQLGRFDEAEQFAERARALEEEHDPAMEPESWHTWRQVLARLVLLDARVEDLSPSNEAASGSRNTRAPFSSITSSSSAGTRNDTELEVRLRPRQVGDHP